jgi:hypothetical protein
LLEAAISRLDLPGSVSLKLTKHTLDNMEPKIAFAQMRNITWNLGSSTNQIKILGKRVAFSRLYPKGRVAADKS